MTKALKIVLKTLIIGLLLLFSLVLVGFIYGWVDRGLLITTDDVAYSQPEDHPVQLPRDLAAHPDFKTEWWYWTGHLTADDGKQYGFELVFFRIRTLGVWHNRIPVWWFFKTHATVGQFAVVDKQTGEHIKGELRAENSQSDVGAALDRMRLWTYDWSAEEQRDEQGNLLMRLLADNGRYKMDLTLRPLKPAVLHGDSGFLDKRPNGVTSNYISFTRMAAEGTLSIDGRPHTVSGQAWHDHEYASGKPSDITAGWDWLSIQFDLLPADDPQAGVNPLDGTELMLYQMRSIDGQPLEGSKGTLVSRSGEPDELLLGHDFTIQAGMQGTWRSPGSGADYPLGWRIELPARGWVIDVTPVSPEQEMLNPTIDVNYWEGACTVSARTPQGEIKGLAYVELCGYDKRVDKF